MSLDLAYFILALCLCAGAIQITAAYSGLRGMLIIPETRMAYAVGIVLPAIALSWFGLSGRATIPGDIGGVEGAEQFFLFLLAAGTTAVATAVIASVTQRGRTNMGRPPPGMEGLRHHTLWQLLRRPRLEKQSPAKQTPQP